MNLYDEVKLYNTTNERDKYENLATLFGIIQSLDYLERAYVRDSINQSEYSPACVKLLAQFKTILKLVAGDIAGSVDEFMAEYKMDCPAAAHRLHVGVPATVEHSAEEGVETGKWVAETTQCFITFMDALRLNLRAKDQLHPMLTDLMSVYSRFKGSSEWEGRPKLVGWLISLNKMKAADEITDEQSRQMLFDVDHAYNEFFRSLGKNDG
ncbi:vacuolar protein sorting-associated protein 28 [Wallemia mellicola CBS 633.66]|uniref:Vacuolar protein sorting-associated protein 28 n=1 Tax=Wallemia mellicola (strain ATCC MYA-4683 / CBS 633.66) TaxID=671144 RepID=I4Y5Z6_WALMC|nr:vacuolar protein sorting-associated protein 28 [Wallemia mellicola CBS 633.66]EIM19388.1 vacuolar protein sorting-associated protein 28 [Wallemia mellicola CBS 633.66]TIC25106.1 vacuolar protein sorting-associated protein 28 [Wallemia mellicola]|eukprot:XP_006960538.1 vacuolar protein sorting-associated protein 28 [Wallemia mellicola CBS 633.66]